jgi:prepilin-type N-terminal cleavage/methylation domain-containing protein
MKNAFTMIELIFVIVIIGIIAAVALPKLSATRDDADISAIISNARIAINDFQAYYIARNNAGWINENIRESTNALLYTACDTPVTETTPISPNTFVLCHDDVICLSFETTVEGQLTITDGTDTTSRVCEAVKTDPAIISMSNKSYILAGKRTVR